MTKLGFNSFISQSIVSFFFLPPVVKFKALLAERKWSLHT